MFRITQCKNIFLSIVLFFGLISFLLYPAIGYTADSIASAEYFFDNDPGEGNGIPLPAADGEFDEPEEMVDVSGIDTSSLKLGYHTLYVRFKNAGGEWGVARSLAHDPFLYNPSNFRITDNQWIADAEYFIDVDPGEGNGISVPAVDGTFDDP